MKELFASSLLQLIRETAEVTWIVGADGFVMDIPEWARLTGQTPEQMQGDGWMDALHPGDVERVRSAWMTAISHCTPYNTDYRLRCADGTYRWFNARGVPVYDADGRVQQWIGVILAIAGHNRFGRGERREGADLPLVDIAAPALRAARALLGWSANELAQHANLSLSTVRRLEDDGERDSSRLASMGKVIEALKQQPLKFHGNAEGVVVGVSLAAPRTGGGEAQQPLYERHFHRLQ